MPSVRPVVLGMAVMVALVAARRSADASYNTSATAYAYAYAPSMNSTVSECDDCVATVTLPWAFPYYGRSFTQVTISSNGFVVLGAYAGASYAGNVAFGADGSAAAPGPVIAPLWDDWSPALAGEVWTGVAGTAFVVEWYGLQHYGQSGGTAVSFEVKLFADGRIEFHYANLLTGFAAWDNGASATIGFQEDVDTVGQPVASDVAGTLSSTARGFTRPGTSALYVKAKDGFYTPAQARANLRFRQSVSCGSAVSSFDVVTGSGPWSSAAVSPCAAPALSGDAGFIAATDGYDVATIPLSPITSVAKGSYRFVKRSDFTPAPTVAPRFSVAYGAYTSKLDYWRGGASIDKVALFVTGFDPLNESSTAQYMVLMGDMVRELLAGGHDVAIGKFADGNQHLTSYRPEVASWINDAYGRNGNRKLQAAGISMGGVILRDTLWWNTGSVTSKLWAWYSVDAPQTGANLGRGDQGMQNLILCNKAPTDPNYQRIFSNAAADMMNNRVTSCSCDDEPENSTCSTSTSSHDAYYNGIGWPTTIPRYAFAFGDGDATGGYAKNGTGKLFDFSYTGVFCSEDSDWNGGQRDCNAGSRYLNAATVNADVDASVCGTFRLRLSYEPAFINIDSALGVATPLSSTVQDGACSSNYPALAPTYWNGWKANTYNEKHTVISAAIKTQAMTWIKLYDP